MEKYLTATNDIELAEKKEVISNVAAHISSNYLVLEMEMKQFRRTRLKWECECRRNWNYTCFK